MTEQEQLFPRTKVETAEVFLEHFQADVESSDKALGNARVRLRAATELRDLAEVNLMRAQRDQEMEVEVGAEDVTDEIEDAEVLQIEGEVVDPITGEVETAGYVDVGRLAPPCPDCDGRGGILDEDGGGHHGTCKTCKGTGLASAAASFEGEESAMPVVIALWPGDEEPHATEIGEKTTYLELIADYCTAVDGFTGGLDDFVVVGEDDLAERRSDDTIAMLDYGHRLVVVTREAVEA